MKAWRMATAKKTAKPSGGLEDTIADIEKTFGVGTIMRMGDERVAQIEAIPTGILEVDAALGIGGWPRGRIVEIFGPPSSGKSTLALHTIAEAQKMGLVCAYVDVEYALDPVYATALGVDIDNMLISQPDNAEQVLEVVSRLAKSGHVGVIVVDSVSALVPRAETEGEMGDSHIGLLARLMSQALRKIVGDVSDTGTLIIFINQLRSKIGVMYGSNETTSGGRALEFYDSVRVDIRKIEAIKDGTDVIGGRTRVKIVKNKVAPPFKQAEFDIIYGRGVPKENSLFNMAVELGVIKMNGAWSNYEGENLAQGAAKTKALLASNEVLFDEINKRVLEKINPVVVSDPSEE